MPHENEGDSQNAPEQQPKYVTEEQIAGVVNAAVTNHLKRVTEKQKTELEAMLKPIVEKLNAPPPPPAEGDDTGKKKQPDPQIAALQQQLEDFKRQAREAEERRVATERKSRDDKAYSDLRAALTGVVKPEMLDVVAGYMFKIQGVVEVPEDGEPVFKTTRNTFGVEEELRLPLKDGVSSWAKSEAAKPFLPAPSSASATPVKKPGHPVQRLPENFNPDNATPEQKLRMAADLEEQIKQTLAANGKSL
jgi:hypothetical protein